MPNLVPNPKTPGLFDVMEGDKVIAQGTLVLDYVPPGGGSQIIRNISFVTVDTPREEMSPLELLS